MVDTVCDWNVYKTPSSEVLRNRRAFYGLQRKSEEPVQQWLKRVQSSIWCCEFPTIIEFLLIDRFVCGLNSKELKTLRRTHSWTAKRLVEMFSTQTIPNGSTAPNLTDSEHIVGNEITAVDLIKSEPDEEGDPHDPFAELVDGSNVFVKIETKFADEEHSILEDLSFDMAADGAIRQETSIDGITSEWEEYDVTTSAAFDEMNGTHTNVPKPVACDLCDKTFNFKSNLSKHRKTVHRAMFSHVCRLCDRRFAFAEDLKNHMTSHTGERLCCNLCNKTFSCLSTLRKHKKSVHQKLRAFACSQCDWRFYSSFELNRHMLLHTGEKPYACDKCTKKFKQSYELLKHRTMMHFKKHKNIAHTSGQRSSSSRS